uniref:Sigma-70 family RNA polymerase sigma factor n=1 Tax=Caldisericum exile TaxID=693075 RepID=A0A7C4XZZ9_9BACT
MCVYRSGEVDERALIQRLKIGDEVAFREFFNHYYERVFFYAYRRVKMREVAEDITQETFLKFVHTLSSFELKEGYHLDTWIYAIERNTIRDWFRRNLGKEVLSLEEKFNNKFKPILEDPFETAENEEINEVVNKAVEQLNENYRDVIKMRFYEGKSIKEIASLLKKSEDNVKVIQFRALKRLREIIEGYINE